MSAVGVIDTVGDVAGGAAVLESAGAKIASSAGLKVGLGVAARVAFKFIPIIGWASLAYDGYQLASFAYDKYEESQANVEILTEAEMEERAQYGSTLEQAGIGTETFAATLAVGSGSLMASKADGGAGELTTGDNKASQGNDNGGRPPKKGWLKSLFSWKSAAGLAAWEVGSHLVNKALEDNTDKQYNEALGFEREVTEFFEGSGKTLSDGDRRLVQGLSMSYGRALAEYDGENDMTEAEYQEVWANTSQSFIAQMEAEGTQTTLTDREIQGLANFTQGKLHEELQPDQYKSTFQKVMDYNPFH
jgi:hypothetical protein